MLARGIVGAVILNISSESWQIPDERRVHVLEMMAELLVRQVLTAIDNDHELQHDQALSIMPASSRARRGSSETTMYS